MTSFKTSVQKFSNPDLSIVIPAQSEERRIGRTLDDLAKFLKYDYFLKNKSVEILIVAADTSDKTHEIVLSKQKLFKNLQLLKPGSRTGKGRDVQYGMSRAKGKVLVYMDADLATPLHHLVQFYKVCTNGYDIVLGTRNLLSYRSSPFRNIFSYIGNLLYRVVSGTNIEDTQCGFKMFSEKAARLCFGKLTIKGWGFDIELLAIAKTNNLAIKSIRINDWEDKPFSTYTEGPLTITKRTIKDIVQIERNKLIGVYKEVER